MRLAIRPDNEAINASLEYLDEAPLTRGIGVPVGMKRRWARSLGATISVVVAVAVPPIAGLVRLVDAVVGLGINTLPADVLIVVGLPVTGLFLASLVGMRRLARSYFGLLGVLSSVSRVVEKSYFGVGDRAGWTIAGVDGAQLAAGALLPMPSFNPLADEELAPMVVDGHAGDAKIENEPGPARTEGVWVARRVERAETWWSLAEEVFGSGEQWAQLSAANEHRLVANGVRCAPGDPLVAGWSIVVPAEAPSNNGADETPVVDDSLQGAEA